MEERVVMNECIEEMKTIVYRFSRGKYTIAEAESAIDNAITMYTQTINGFDQKLVAIRKLKRKKYRMLLEATR